MTAPDFVVRPLAPDEADRWVALEPIAGADPTVITNRLIPLLHAPARDEAEFLVAATEEGLLGRLRCQFLPDRLARCYAPVVPAPALREEVSRSLLARFLAECWGRQLSRIQAVVLPDQDSAEEAAATFRALGFQFAEERWVATRDLRDWRAPSTPSELTFRDLHEAGNREFVAVLDQVMAVPTGPIAEAWDSQEALQAMRAAADPLFEPALWQLAYRGEEAVGIVIPQPMPSDPITGDLYFVGVVPSHRGQGLGRALVDRGLAQLKLQWVERLRVGFDPSNGPWRKLVEGLDVEIVERQWLFEGPRMV